ncbi:hypothetical protein [Sporisorium scitamineum]|uniref:Delta 8-(E)-sphingolipid desaturase n=1 Tax=Sporisorium scitamineum TaxID=49012 RepID=A0A0F7S6K6_9BASI|nr:hypothetical protein [Sporisorium scitamineum]
MSAAVTVLPNEVKRETRQPKTLTRAQLAERIAQGETLVLHRRKIYKVDRWLARHPGGELTILHFVGRDATDEIEAYHSDDTISRLMSRFVIGHLDEADWHNYRPLVPPVQLGYRRGKLDHPHAQVAMWRHRNTPATSSAASDRASQEPDSSSDSSDKALVEDLVSATSEGSRIHSTKPSSKSRNQSRGKAVSSSTLIVERPETFPLPVDLLEPPPNPDSIDPIREHRISQAYQRLHQQVKDADLYTLRPIGYAREMARYVLLASIAYAFWSRGQSQLLSEQSPATSPPSTLKASTTSFLLSSLFLGLFWHQLTFSAHDSGHSGITHSWQWDRIIGTTIADLIGGLSIGWWCDNHDVHHLVTNHPEHDPDIQHMPFFAISPQFVLASQTTIINSDNSIQTSAPSKSYKPLGLWSSYYRRVLKFDAPSRFLLKHQHKLYYIVMAFGRFNLYANSYAFLALKARRDRWWALELMGLLFFWTWYGYGLLGSLPSWPIRIAYLLISHVVTLATI